MRAFRISLLLSLAYPVFAEDLYLLGGTPERLTSEGYASVLYSVQESNLIRVRTINTTEEPSRFIRVSHEGRRIAIGRNNDGGYPDKFWFVDMDNPQVVREWNAGSDPLVVTKPAETWTGFLALPGGIALATKVYGALGPQLLGVREHAGTFEFELWQQEYIKYARPSGWSGYGAMDGIGLRFQPSSTAGMQRALVPLGWTGAEVFGSLPHSWTDGVRRGSLQVRNSFVSVLRQVVDKSGGTQGYSRNLILRDEMVGQWRSWTVPGDSRTGPHATAFGPWVVATETADSVPGVKLPPERRFTKEDHELPSRWDTKVPTGPHLRARRHYHKTRPGRIHMMHVPSGRTLVLEPGDPDSEILLIEGKTIYYRANDEIYSAPLTDSGIGPRKLLAKGEEILDVHWAFLSGAKRGSW